MRRLACFWPLLLFVAACSSSGTDPSPGNDLFKPVSMKLTTFSKMQNWSGHGPPEGVEAVVEFDDQFGDRTKAAGVLIFELYSYRPGYPDPRGIRVVNPWRGPLQNVNQQKAHWERATEAYAFRLAYEGLLVDHDYVLEATFQQTSGTRYFSQIMIPALVKPEPKNVHRATTTTQPSGAKELFGH